MIIETLRDTKKELNHLETKIGGLDVAKPIVRPSELGNFALVPSNVEAVEAAKLFTSGQIPFVALIGPSGWGKSHLIQRTHQALSDADRERAVFSSANQFLNSGVRPEAPALLVLDDAQASLERLRTRNELRLALELRLRLKRPTLLAFCAESGHRRIASQLPSAHRWAVFSIRTPKVRERILVVKQLAANCDINLSPRLIEILAIAVGGNARSIQGALNRLKLSQSMFLSPTDELFAIGQLQPILMQSEGSLTLKVIQSIRSALARHAFEDHSQLEMCFAAFLLRSGFRIPECQVARDLGISIGMVHAHLEAMQFALTDNRVQDLLDSSIQSFFATFHSSQMSGVNSR
jgi:chromosomal replication initiation ATPase DnaA